MADWKMKGKPALLILHMQQSIVGAGSEMHPDNARILREAGVVTRQQELLKAFRDRGLPVIYVNAMPRPIDCPVPPYGFLWNSIETMKPGAKDTEVIPELAPQAGEPVLSNWLFSPFNNSGLDLALKVSGAETLVMAGFSTNGVINSGVQGAADRYYPVIVPGDACAAPSPEAHRAVLELIAPAVALVTTTEDVLAHLA